MATSKPCTIKRNELLPIVAGLHKATKDAKDAWRRMVTLETSTGHLWLRASGEHGRVEIPVPCTGTLKPVTVDCGALNRALRTRFSGGATLEFEATNTTLLIVDAAWAPSARRYPERLQTGIISPSRLTDAKAVGCADSAVLRSAVLHVLHARSLDETRPHMTGLQVRCDKAGIRLIATDGHRLAVAPVAIAWKRIADVDLCLTADAAELLPLLPEQGIVTLYISDRGMEIEQEKAFYLDAAGLPEGAFHCEQVIPSELDGKTITLDMTARSALQREVQTGLDAIDLLVSPEGFFVERTLNGNVRITSGRPDLAPSRVRVCARYLAEALAHICLNTTIQFGNYDPDLNPIVIRQPDNGRIEVIMPMRK